MSSEASRAMCCVAGPGDGDLCLRAPSQSLIVVCVLPVPRYLPPLPTVLRFPHPPHQALKYIGLCNCINNVLVAGF